MSEERSAAARDKRSALYLEDERAFFHLLNYELRELTAEAKSKGLIPSCRLNAASEEIPFEEFHRRLFDDHPDVEFYDYTRIPSRMNRFLSGFEGPGEWPGNYHLTFSFDGNNRDEAQKIFHNGGNIAAKFHPFVPPTWEEEKTLDGDQYDARFLDVEGGPYIIGLTAEGNAHEDSAGFVVRIMSVA